MQNNSCNCFLYLCRMRIPLFLIPFFFVSYFIQAQAPYPRDYFGSPVNIPITLAGNFGEIRPNHLHAGFDIRTNNKEGLPVYAVADGYVSRIRISPVGYGKALYITHPNGYVSVYGHLRGFNTAIQAKTTTIQTMLQSFEMDTLLNRESLPVKKGELIGFSGNTGSSQAPHLHFEIREELSEIPINPYYFGYQVKDEVKPVIVSIAVYPIGIGAQVNGKNKVKKIVPRYEKGKYIISKADSLFVDGTIGFGINCFDKESSGSGTNNVFSIEMQSGGKRIYYYEMEKFSFDNARYVNTHIDYAEKQRSKQVIQKCFLSENNQLEIYRGVQQQGIINFNDDADHWITFIVKDYAGNTAELALKVRSKPLKKGFCGTTDATFDCLKENSFVNGEIDVFIPPMALYDDLAFVYKKAPQLKGTLSPLYYLSNETVALQKAMIIKIKAAALPVFLQEKACIISINKKGGFEYEGGVFTNGSVLTESKHFGKFAIAVDTVAPRLIPLIKLSKTDSIADFKNLKVLKFKATDNLSGIKKYRATIDGKWVLCEYDLKNDLLFYTFDSMVKTGTHLFKLDVTDDKGNKKEWKIMFKR